jgi:hypothetical protein
MTQAVDADVAVAQGAEALEAVAVASERMTALASSMRGRPGVRRVVPGVDCRRYRSGSTFDVYVEVELASDNVLTWWLEVDWTRRWTIESRVLLNHDGGQDVVRAFPDRWAEDSVGFTTELAAAVDELVGSAEGVDLTRY